MLGSVILDTAIGLVFVFLLVSILVTIANEMVAAMFLSRAKWLQKGIDQLLGSEFAGRLYAHPLIEASSAAPTAAKEAPPPSGGSRQLLSKAVEWIWSGWKVRGEGPSYIPSRAFATVLLDVVSKDPTVVNAQRAVQNALDQYPAANRSIGTLRAAVQKAFDESITVSLNDLAGKLRTSSQLQNPAQALQNVRDATQAIPYIEVAHAINKDLREMLNRIETKGYTVEDAKTDIQRFIDGVPSRYLRDVIKKLSDVNPKVGDALTALLDDADHDIEKFKENIEVWFNNAMDRVGGWYKRRTQWIVFILSLGISIVLNVDTLLLAQQLNTQGKMRDALVAQAKGFAEHPPVPVTSSGAAISAQAAVGSGELFKGSIEFDKAAAAEETVHLISNDKEIQVDPASATVQKGENSVAFKFNAPDVMKTKSVQFDASGSTLKGSTTVEIRPALDARFRAVQTQLDQLGLPIGWFREETSMTSPETARAPAVEAEKITLRPTEFQRRNFLVAPRWNGLSAFGDWCGNWWDVIMFHFVGWLLTALAATLGAPFWFDTLNKIMSIRSAGKAPEETPKPPKEVPTPVEPGQSPREADRINSAKKK